MQEYRYEFHAHTSEVSACGRLPAARLVDMHADLGYHGLLVTDHLHELFIRSQPNPGDWRACCEAYWKGHEAAKRQGDIRGLDILTAMEVSFVEENGDYLLIGLTPEMLLEMPYPHRMGLAAFWERWNRELVILNAHPYRGGRRQVRPALVHGVEGINCNPRHTNHNARAMALCHSHPRLLCTCGSDVHQPEDVGRSAMVFPHRLRNAADARRALLAGDYHMECDEFRSLLPRKLQKNA